MTVGTEACRYDSPGENHCLPLSGPANLERQEMRCVHQGASSQTRRFSS